jgi:hypothetical protein
MLCFFFGVLRVDFKDSPVDKIGHISNFGPLADGYRFAIFPGDQQILDRNAKFFGKLYGKNITCSKSSP